MALPSRCTEAPMSQQPSTHYVRTHEYVAGAGRVQRTNFYALAGIDSQIGVQLEPVSSDSHCFPEGEFVPPGFFERVHSDMFALPPRMNDWKYHMRREAQMILPFLYLGPWACLKDRVWLEREGFTLLLAVRDQRLAHARLISGEKAAMELGIETCAVDTVDNQDLITALPRAIRLINDHVSTPANAQSHNSSRRKILLFCETGNGHSAGVLVAYLMAMFNLKFHQALQIAHLQRFCIDIDEPLKNLLLSFESILAAKRDVESSRRMASANPGLATLTTTNRKRDLEDPNDMEDSMDMDGHDGLFPARRGTAPFQDR
ncbi:dual specificity protein phosphatase 3 [Aspergillus steynii IBT 23096]|uniref:Dual specificity protein phosphatase 3 n=1 Tax=Aspergillus steynii IBT 23096 TaxID=1392250 RepID=A0A2I2FSG7_9EURO|nr:dual specificity protein phosphatase 3 [Aspergillus steynii IBT 23096]PLB43551.1 dual specificity protein phosphatase 3 [Aspergillus steynii IBT 23096]